MPLINIQFMIYKNFVGVNKNFPYFFNAHYVQLAETFTLYSWQRIYMLKSFDIFLVNVIF